MTGVAGSSRLDTTRARLLTSLMAAAGSPGGSVQASVTRSGSVAAAVLVAMVTMNVWLSPVASALVGFWSRKKLAQLALGTLVTPSGRESGRLTNPQPS